jgi:hypothetical protein
MNKIVNLVISKFSRSYTQYRFDSISNFLSYEQFQEKEAIDTIIRLGKELERIRQFENMSDEELQQLDDNRSNIHHDAVNNISIEDRNHIYYKDLGIDASYELKRRKKEKKIAA